MTIALANGRRISLVVLLLLIVHIFLLAYGAWIHSPTLNEPGHLAAGVSYWQFGRFGLYNVNPPLVRLVAALPVMVVGCETDWRRLQDGTRPELLVGDDFIAANGRRSFWLVTIARWACIPFSLIGALVCFSWARELYGSRGGLFALALWCFCPNILAHGQLITPDTAATSLGLAASYAFWHWLRSPHWRGALLSGGALGLAALAKMTLIIFICLWPVLWLLYRWPSRSVMRARHWLGQAGMLLAVLASTFVAINQGYAFEGSLTKLSNFRFVSRTMTGADRVNAAGANRFSSAPIGHIPIPLPANFLLGMDLQKADFENSGAPSYLHGEWSERGWWYYYLYAVAVKCPVGTLCLSIMAALFWSGAHRVTKRDEFCLLLPSIAILMFVSSQTGLNRHMRYALPAFPYVFIWIGRVDLGGLWRSVAVSSALLWSAGSVMLVYPHCLAYFNECAGGPQHGPRHLLHSNIDWGQDLIKLRHWLENHPEANPLALAYYGPGIAHQIGIDFTLPPEAHDGIAPAVRPGWYAISVTLMNGSGAMVQDGHCNWHQPPPFAYEYFKRLTPIARVGFSIYVYHVERPIAAGVL